MQLDDFWYPHLSLGSTILGKKDMATFYVINIKNYICEDAKCATKCNCDWQILDDYSVICNVIIEYHQIWVNVAWEKK